MPSKDIAHDGSFGIGHVPRWLIWGLYPHVCDHKGQGGETLCPRERATAVLGRQRSHWRDGGQGRRHSMRRSGGPQCMHVAFYESWTGSLGRHIASSVRGRSNRTFAFGWPTRHGQSSGVDLAPSRVSDKVSVNVGLTSIVYKAPGNSPVCPPGPSFPPTSFNMPILGCKAPGPSKPAHFNLESLIRPNILALQPYRCARDDYSAGILLDANENAVGPALPGIEAYAKGARADGSSSSGPGESASSAASSSATTTASTAETITADTLSVLTEAELLGLNRYPSPTHDELKRQIAKFRGVPDENWVFLGVGSDECIDMLFRVLCVPGKDRVMTLPPTYGMYKVTANVNDVGVLQVPLVSKDGAFQIDEPAVSCGAVVYFTAS